MPPELPGVSRAYLIGHPEMRTPTVVAVTATLSAIAWAMVIAVVWLSSTELLDASMTTVQLVVMMVGIAVLLGFAAVAAAAVHVVQTRMAHNQQQIYQAIEDSGAANSSYEQAVCDLLGAGKVTAIPRQRP